MLSVDPRSSGEHGSESSADPPTATKSRTPDQHDDHGVPALDRYSPVVLVVDVVHLLQNQGVMVSEAVDKLHEAVEASAELLRRIGVVPDRSVISRPAMRTAELVAAAVLLRAAGIEPGAVRAWPRRSV
jgi:hypothetical protein